MKKILIVCIAGFMIACNSETRDESSNESTVKDSIVIEQNHTMNKDTMVIPLTDTMGAHRDSLHK